MGHKIHKLQMGALLIFLASALTFLTGAENDKGRGTLPLRGDGTLPLRVLPDGGTLPLIVSGVAINPKIVVPPNRKPKETALALDLQIAKKAKPVVQVEEAESLDVLEASQPLVEVDQCVEVFGPTWETGISSGTLLVGKDQLIIDASCINTLTNDVALIASVEQKETTLSCLVTALRTTEGFSSLTGELSCSLPVAGATLLVFKALTQG
jgi:hypothetical protein